MPDWRSFLKGYAATLDGPMCLCWRELAECFPKANVLLLLRDPGTWYDSVCATVYPVMRSPKADTDPVLKMVHRVFFHEYFDGQFENRAHAINTYHQYCEEVRQTIPKNRLLEYSVTQGWEPLCNFLGYPVPDIPFPKRNTRDDFLIRNP